MKTFLLSLSLCIAFGFSGHAYAENYVSAEFAADGIDGIRYQSVYGTSGFPLIDGRLTQVIRAYYSTKSFDSIDMNSPYFESRVLGTSVSNFALSPFRFRGLGSGRYFIRLAAIDQNGDVLFFSKEDNFDQQSVVIP